MYCTHCTPTGLSANNPIVHGLVRLLLYPLLTSWSAIGYNPLLGSHGSDQGLESFIYNLGSFLGEILNMMAVKNNTCAFSKMVQIGRNEWYNLA